MHGFFSYKFTSKVFIVELYYLIRNSQIKFGFDLWNDFEIVLLKARTFGAASFLYNSVSYDHTVVSSLPEPHTYLRPPLFFFLSFL